MKTNDFLQQYKNQKRQFLQYVKCVFANNMVLQNIDVPEGWVAEAHTFGVRITPQWIDGNERPVLADEFDRVVRKISRNFRSEPSIEIDKERMNADWWLYPKFERKTVMYPVNIDLRCGNTEACELIEKEVVVKKYELTGFCKALAEKKFVKISAKNHAELTY